MLLIQNIINEEFLSEEEIEELTGAKQLKYQIQYLIDRDWQFELNRKNRIMVSRWYTRLKLSGLKFNDVDIEIDTAIQPDFGRIK
ncbi:DUF4224 domain-containing protein [Methylophaga thiooxydans]|uniref:DUF4224 domain-containing protein n=1 Tax=Methylophaga thiooxydans TaxID=392484 RepID=UPI00235463ED|nr:DUF4224 domain-containing protein [Methylophaga thiooxydans]